MATSAGGTTGGSMPFGWDDLRLIRAVAEARGMAGAAAHLQIDQSTVFRRLGLLEANLGVPLFERHRSGYALTPTGEEVVAAAGRIDAEVTRLERRLRGKDILPAGEIRVATADSLLVHLLLPLFARFRRACPDIHLDLVIGNAALNLSKRDADIAIRATDAPPETLVGRRIGTIAWALYGRRDPGHDDPQAPPRPAAAEPEPWVGLSEDMAGLKVVRDLQPLVAARQVAFRTNSVLALAEAIEAGLGIGHLPCFVGDGRPGLARRSGLVADYAAGLWLLTHPDLRQSPRIRAFLDFIAGELSPLKPWIEGSGLHTAPADP